MELPSIRYAIVNRKTCIPVYDNNRRAALDRREKIFPNLVCRVRIIPLSSERGSQCPNDARKTIRFETRLVKTRRVEYISFFFTIDISLDRS